MMRIYIEQKGMTLCLIAAAAASFVLVPLSGQAQAPDTLATNTASTTGQGGFQLLLESKDLTQPEPSDEKEATLALLARRPIESPKPFSLMAWWVQQAIKGGIPANTVVLILLLPFLAVLVAFFRVIIGLPSLEMLVPIALAYVLVAVGIATGAIILAAVVAASFISRVSLRRVRIMHYPKRSLSMLLLALMVFAALTLSVSLGVANLEELSIFPILIMTLLGDSLVSVQLHKTMREAVVITAVTIVLGIAGYYLAVAGPVRDLLILYPEIVLLTIPANILMGRYFGLRLSELVRFKNFSAYGG